jgi:8-oxo-dGTP pyrophosphatase MutT (NUDIX family)
MIQKLRRLLHLETTEEALRDFAGIIEQGGVFKSEIDTMAREYLGSRGELDKWAVSEHEPDVQELIKAQQDGLTSRYLAFLADKQKEHFRLEERKQFYTAKYPDFEKALSDLKKNDFIEHILTSYRNTALSLEESNTLIKAVTKSKVQYADNIVFNQKGELLIVQRQPLGGEREGANLWVLPGGHVKMGEKFDVAAQRELLEETGYIAEDVYHVGDFDDDTVHIEYYCSMVDTDEQSPVVDAAETRATEFIHIKDLYKHPTIHNMWDKVYEILGIEEHVVKIKKAIAEGIVKNERVEVVVDDKISELIKGCGGSGVKAKFKKVMDKWKAGKLKSSESDETVTSQKQAIAIALSETGQSKEKAVETVIEKAQKDILKTNEGESVKVKSTEPVKWTRDDKTDPFDRLLKNKKDLPTNVKNRLDIGVTDLTSGELKKVVRTPYKGLPVLSDGTLIMTVDELYVQKHLSDDFVNGGNGYAYPNFIPEDERWISDDQPEDEEKKTLIHEVTEPELMRLNPDLPYSTDKGINAHDLAKMVDGFLSGQDAKTLNENEKFDDKEMKRYVETILTNSVIKEAFDFAKGKRKINKSVEGDLEKAIALKDMDDKGILRQAITAEYDAINLYEQIAETVKDEKLKKLFLDIAKEEKVHVGEFEALLLKIDKEQTSGLEEGKKEEAKTELKIFRTK